MRDNEIEQDLIRNVIYLGNRKIMVQLTSHTSIMPTAPIFGNQHQVNKNKSSQLLSFKFRILLPEQEVVREGFKKKGTNLGHCPKFGYPLPPL